MNNILPFLKSNIASLASIITSAGIVIGAYVAFSSNYVSAEEYQKDLSSHLRALKSYQTETRMNFRKLEIQSIDDKIFMMEISKNPTDQDKALLNRLNRQRADAVMLLERQLLSQ